MYENDTACWWLGVVGDGNERVEQALCFGVDEDHGYSFEHPGSPQKHIWKEWTFERRASLDAEVLATVGIDRGTFQPLRSWLKALAPLNMYSMSVTCPVSHLLMSWLKAVAP